MGAGAHRRSGGGELYVLAADPARPEAYEATRERAGTRARVSGELYRRQGVAALIARAVEPAPDAQEAGT